MKASICMILFVLVAYELSSGASQGWLSNRSNRKKLNQKQISPSIPNTSSQRFTAKSRQQGIPKPRQGKQLSSGVSQRPVSKRFNRKKVNQQRIQPRKPNTNSQRFSAKGSRQQGIPKPRQGKQLSRGASQRPGSKRSNRKKVSQQRIPPRKPNTIS